MRHVWVQDMNLQETSKNQVDQFLIFRYVIEKISAWSFLNAGFLQLGLFTLCKNFVKKVVNLNL